VAIIRWASDRNHFHMLQLKLISTDGGGSWTTLGSVNDPTY
jgi:hypothetical protein